MNTNSDVRNSQPLPKKKKRKERREWYLVDFMAADPSMTRVAAGALGFSTLTSYTACRDPIIPTQYPDQFQFPDRCPQARPSMRYIRDLVFFQCYQFRGQLIDHFLVPFFIGLLDLLTEFGHIAIGLSLRLIATDNFDVLFARPP
jgi:hypothetical protein